MYLKPASTELSTRSTCSLQIMRVSASYWLRTVIRFPTKRIPDRGLETFKEHEGYYCFHAGTKFKDGEIVTNGGRVLGVTALGDTLKEARANAYKAVDWVDFDNKYYRHDIGKAIDEA